MTDPQKSILGQRLSLLALLALLAAFLAYGLAFIDRTAFEVDGQPVHALFDDAMISMQYAKNLARGDGLVWNAGETPVEGYSNLLWLLVMSVVHLFPIPLTLTSYYVKLISLAALALNLALVHQIARLLTPSRLAPLLAVFLTAFYYPLNSWSLHGMEVGFLAFLVNAAIWLALRARRDDRFSLAPYLAAALAILTRMDAALLILVLSLGMAWLDAPRRRRHLAWGLGATLLTLAALTLFRFSYYGDWLPNTYYLKLGGISTLLRISLGLRVFWDFVWTSNWLLFLLPFTLLALDGRKSIRLLFAITLAQFAYSIYVGGDAWEHNGGANRFVAVVMPLFFILFALALKSLGKLILTQADWRSRRAHQLSSVAITLIAVISLFSFNTLLVQDGIAKWTLIEKPIFTESVERYARMGLNLAELTTQNANIAVVTAGNIPYFTGRTCVDILGKNDPVIAHGPARINSSLFHPADFRPGHNKWDYAYSIGELNPDVVAQTWEGTDEEVAPYLANYELYVIEGIPYYFRVDSDNILWERIPPQN